MAKVYLSLGSNIERHVHITSALDILAVDDVFGHYDGIELPRDEILKNAFVLQPLAELIPDNVHPVTGKSYQQHWIEYDKEKQKLWPIDFRWKGKL